MKRKILIVLLVCFIVIGVSFMISCKGNEESEDTTDNISTETSLDSDYETKETFPIETNNEDNEFIVVLPSHEEDRWGEVSISNK